MAAMLLLLLSHFCCCSRHRLSDCAGLFVSSQKPGLEHSLHRPGHETTGSQPAGDTQVRTVTEYLWASTATSVIRVYAFSLKN